MGYTCHVRVGGAFLPITDFCTCNLVELGHILMQYDLSAHTKKFDEVIVFGTTVGKRHRHAFCKLIYAKLGKVWQVISSFEYLACESIDWKFRPPIKQSNFCFFKYSTKIYMLHIPCRGPYLNYVCVHREGLPE